MVIRFDDDYYKKDLREEYATNTSTSWFAPLLLLPIAFLSGWVLNGYMAEGQLNQPSNIEIGVGGGPDDMQTPLPSSGEKLTPSPSATATPSISPTITPDDE